MRIGGEDGCGAVYLFRGEWVSGEHVEELGGELCGVGCVCKLECDWQVGKEARGGASGLLGIWK